MQTLNYGLTDEEEQFSEDLITEMLKSDVNPDEFFTESMVDERDNTRYQEEGVLDKIVELVELNPTEYFKSKRIVPESDFPDAFLLGRNLKTQRDGFVYCIVPSKIWDKLDITDKVSSPVIDNEHGQIWLHIGNGHPDHVNMFKPLDENNPLTAGINEVITKVIAARAEYRTDVVEVDIVTK